MKCKICGSELNRTSGSNVKPGVRYDCPNKDCPVIFARKMHSGKIKWVLEAKGQISND